MLDQPSGRQDFGRIELSDFWAFLELSENKDLLSGLQNRLLAEVSPNGVFQPPVTRSGLQRAGLLDVMPNCYIHRLTLKNDRVEDARILFAGTVVTRVMGEVTGLSMRDIERKTNVDASYVLTMLNDVLSANEPLLARGEKMLVDKEQLSSVSLLVPMQGRTPDAPEILACIEYYRDDHVS